jgi:Sulfotransferase domain
LKANFVGIGAHKCASTWVYRVLQEHPQAFVSQPKELEYFSKHADRTREWYEGHFQTAGAALARGEISTTYFNWPDTAQRIHDYNPDMRLVLSLRDPVRRAYSHHLFSLQQGELEMKHLSFEAGLAAGGDYLRKSTFAPHLREWLNVFPRDQLLVLFLEDIAERPEEQSARLFEFLGLDTNHEPESLRRKANQSYLPRSRGVKSMINAGRQLAEKLGCSDTLWKIRHTSLVSKLLDLNKTDIRSRVPEMRPETRDELEQHFASDVLETARLLQLDSLPWATWQRAHESHKP